MLIVAVTYRYIGHYVNDPGKYMPEDKLAYYKACDPVDCARAELKDMTTDSADEIAAIEAEIAAEYAAAVEFSVNSPEVSVAAFAAFAEGYRSTHQGGARMAMRE